jgi:ABC-type multidrug transport system fused ATPase/permease subunit
MIKSLKKIFYMLDNNFKKKLFLVQILLLFSAFFEMLGVLSIAPLIHLISDVNVLNDSNQLVTKIFLFFNISDYVSFLKLISVTVLLIFIVNFIVGVYTIYVIEKFAQEAGNFLKLKLFKIFSLQPWIFHSQRETTTYLNKIVTETSRISQSAILPLLQTNAKLLSGLAIIIFIFMYNPKITIICFLVFFISYFLIFKTVRRKIDRD